LDEIIPLKVHLAYYDRNPNRKYDEDEAPVKDEVDRYGELIYVK